MLKRKKENNKRFSIIKFILIVIIIGLLGFLVYKLVFEDVLGIMEDYEDNPVISAISDFTEVFKEDSKEDETNVEVITPIIDQDEQRAPEIITETTHYYYKQLDEAGKIIYEALENNKENMKSGTYKIDFKNKFNNLLNTDGGDKKLNESFQSAWNAFSYDHVDVFYIDVSKLILTTQTTSIASFSKHRVTLSNGNNENYFEEGIESSLDARSKSAYILRVREQMISQLEGYTDIEKIKYLHDWIIDNFRYDSTYAGNDIHNIYGAFANQEVVCEGYARTFKYVLDGLGIENVLVSGTATNSQGNTESHAWNYVKIKGKWYGVDVTWDDPIITGGGHLTTKLRYQYFLKGSDNFFKNHEEDGYLSPNSMKFNFPTLDTVNYDY